MNRIMKHRRIKTTFHEGKIPLTSIGGAIADLPGVSEARYDGTGSLELKYDLMETNLDRIETAVKKLGIGPAAGLLDRFKRGWIHYTEKNEYDNLMSLPSSCCALDEHDRVIREEVHAQKPLPKKNDLTRRGMERF